MNGDREWPTIEPIDQFITQLDIDMAEEKKTKMEEEVKKYEENKEKCDELTANLKI